MRAQILGGSAVVATMALLLTALSITPEARADAPPLPATLIAPADGATAPSGTPLTVTAGDPDGGPLTVSFHAAIRGTEPGPAPAAPFTFLALPDTQGYVITPTYTEVLRTQLQWIVANRQRLNLAFVTGLGDIVDNDLSSAQWSRATDSMAILDQGSIPYAVLPGNHDFDLTTGQFPGYDANFPVSRFRDATWNSAAAHYGGYYGQNEFGPDAADRQNMNSYSVFTAGNMEFLLLNLELNPPDDVLAWADRVLDAHPSHRAIIATHSYLFTTGTLSNQVQRTDVVGNSGAQMFNELVAPNCNVFLVLNGHFSNGTEGEANRVDQNACGEPVYAALSDFQGRPNGGDGWLRYYTFDPQHGTITATTYSPSRDEYETDPNSTFSMPYDMAPPAELPEIASVNVVSGETASVPLPDAPEGSIVDWYVVTDDGSTETRSATWSVTASDPEPEPTTLAADAFGRTTASGWGTADTGGFWSVNSTSKTSTDGTSGRIASNAGSTLTTTLAGVSATDIDLTAQATIDRIPNQWLGLSVSPRLVEANAYHARLRIKPNQTVTLELLRNSTVLASQPLSAITATPGTAISIRVQAEGTSPTTIRARAWTTTGTEPTDWQLTTTDNTAALQAPGAIRLTSYLSSSATNGPVAVTWDDLVATAIE